MKYKLSSEPIMLVYAFNYTMWVAVIPQLILHKVCLHKYADTSEICSNITHYPAQQLTIQKETSWWQMAFFLSINLLSIFTLLILGPLTDAIGRKKGFMFVAGAMVVMNIILVINTHFMSISPAYLLLCSLVAGSFGDLAGVILLTYSDMADLTDHDHSSRTIRFGILEGSLFLALGIGGISSGQLIERFGFTSIPIVSIILASLLLVYIVAWLPSKRSSKHDDVISTEREELLTASREVEYSEENIIESSKKIKSKESDENKVTLSLFNPFTHVSQVFNVFTVKETRCILILLFCSYCLAMFNITGDGYILPLYLKNAPFNVSPQTLGYLIGLHGFVGGVGALIGGVLSYRFNVSDYTLLFVGIACQCTAFLMNGFARSLTLILIGRVVGMTHPVVSCTFRSAITKIAGGDNKHGSILAATECIDVCSGVVASFALLGVYRASLDVYSGIAFFVLAGISVIGILFLLIAKIYSSYSNRTNEK